MQVCFEQIAAVGGGPAEYWWRDEHHQWHKGGAIFFLREVEDLFWVAKCDQSYSGGGFKYFLKIFSPRFLGEDSHFDWYFSKGWNHQIVMDDLGGIFHCSPRLMAERVFLFETNSKYHPCNSKGKTGLPKQKCLRGCYGVYPPSILHCKCICTCGSQMNSFVHWHKVWIMI